MNDLESQLANLTIKQEVIQKENECLYLCKKCKWNIVIVILSLGLISLTGINIKTIVDNYNEANKVAENCKQRIFELKGAIAAVEDILKPDEPATES